MYICLDVNRGEIPTQTGFLVNSATIKTSEAAALQWYREQYDDAVKTGFLADEALDMDKVQAKLRGPGEEVHQTFSVKPNDLSEAFDIIVMRRDAE